MSDSDIPRKKGTAAGVFYDGPAAMAEFRWGQIIIQAVDLDVLDWAFQRLTGHDLDRNKAAPVAVFQHGDVKEALKGGASDV